MRENRLSGSEGGGAANPALPTPIQGSLAASSPSEHRQFFVDLVALSA